MYFVLQINNRRFNRYEDERETNGEINFDNNGSGDTIRGRHNDEFQAFTACMSGSISFIEEYLACNYEILFLKFKN